MTFPVALFLFSLFMSGIAIRIAMPLAHRFGVVDRPGGHKLHDRVTPFVGGVGVFAALLATLSLAHGFATSPGSVQWLVIGLAGLVMFITGLLDDIFHLSFRLRFVVQACVALMMVFWGGVELHDLGELAFGATLELGFLAIPFTLFATIGVINALNMIDGIDGLSGSVSLVTLFLLAVVAFASGASDYALLALGLLGGVAGFLFFNLRFLSQRRARVFLGDNGSMLLGFLFAWLLIALSQGPGRAITPVAALWLLSIPLMDTLGVMLRRIWLGKSPFRPDRHHLHHLFIRAGFRIQDIVYAIALIQLTLGAIGILGMRMQVPEHWMLAAYLAVFVLYFYLVARPWRFVPALRRVHTALGLTSPDTSGVFLGHCEFSGAQELIAGIASEMSARDDYRLSVYQSEREGRQVAYVYAVMELLVEDNDATVDETRGLVEDLKRRFKGKHGIRVRQFLVRNSANDRRVGRKPAGQELRSSDRRSRHHNVLIHATHGLDQSDVVVG